MRGHWPEYLWVYFAASIAGMLAAAELFRARRGLAAVLCGKVHHPADAPCMFRYRCGGIAGGAQAPPQRSQPT